MISALLTPGFIVVALALGIAFALIWHGLH